MTKTSGYAYHLRRTFIDAGLEVPIMPPRHEPAPDQMSLTTPRPGKFKIQQDGVWRPVLIEERRARDPETFETMDRAPVFIATFDGREELLDDRLWTSLHPATDAEYATMVDLYLHPAVVPDFGQGEGHNSRDGELFAAAGHALTRAVDVQVLNEYFKGAATGTYTLAATSENFRKVALLVKQIIAEEKASHDLIAQLSQPLKAALERIREQHRSDASLVKDELKDWLGTYAEAHGIPFCPETSPYWREDIEIKIENASLLPRWACQPDLGAIRHAAKEGRAIPGVTITRNRRIVVV